MNYPTFETRYGQAGAATSQISPTAQGAGGMAPPQAPQEQPNPWSQKLDPWALSMQDQQPQQAAPGKK